MSWEDLPIAFREMAESVCTKKELEVLRLQAKGLGRPRIARILRISESTVRSRAKNAYHKLERANNEGEAA